MQHTCKCIYKTSELPFHKWSESSPSSGQMLSYSIGWIRIQGIYKCNKKNIRILRHKYSTVWSLWNIPCRSLKKNKNWFDSSHHYFLYNFLNKRSTWNYFLVIYSKMLLIILCEDFPFKNRMTYFGEIIYVLLTKHTTS